MARDYKPAARSRINQPSGSGSSLLVGMVIGLLLGLGIALGVAIFLNKGPDPFISRSKPVEPEKAAKQDGGSKLVSRTKAEEPAKATEKPRFDFYNILPGADDPKDKSQAKSGADGARALPPVEVKETFYVQAGAFQSAADADNLKARLALLGVEAAVQSGLTMDRGQLHRVRVGPFTRVEEVNRVRDTLKQNGIETTLIKGREAPK